jgi:DNA-3-methyladenine glycosylase II
VSPLSPLDYTRARRILMRRDPALGRVIKQVGACGLAGHQHGDPLSALAGSIISQQLSGKAAATIFGRFLALFPDRIITGTAPIAALDDATLRGVGLSRQKVSYLRDLCARIDEGHLQLDTLETSADEEVIQQLTAVKGIGRWTAEMFLMFRLHRLDVLPVGDLGIVKAVQELYRLRKPPDAKRLLAIGEAWRPYRSVACWYLWHMPKK